MIDFFTSWSSSFAGCFQTNFIFFIGRDSPKGLPEVDCSRFIMKVGYMGVLFVDTYFSFLSNVPLDETFSSYYFLDEVSSFDVESSKDFSTTEIVLSKEITGVDLSS